MARPRTTPNRDSLQPSRVESQAQLELSNGFVQPSQPLAPHRDCYAPRNVTPNVDIAWTVMRLNPCGERGSILVMRRSSSHNIVPCQAGNRRERRQEQTKR
jgi:hypothetical protein